MPAAMLNNQEPVKKRSKLVLPEPQISDTVSYYSEYLHVFKDIVSRVVARNFVCCGLILVDCKPHQSVSREHPLRN